MEAVGITCPNCRAQYRVRRENLGKRARCTQCNESFVVTVPDSRGQTEGERAAAGLIPCPFCGFQDSGNFCSSCGGRLLGQPTLDFDRCKISTAYISQFPGRLSFDLGAPSAQREREQQEYEIRQACEHFNQQIDEMARVIRYKGARSANWQFDRLSVGRLIDSLPKAVPDRQEIVERLWTIVSDVEQASSAETIKDVAHKVTEALKAGDSKKAQKALARLRSFCSGERGDSYESMLSEFEVELGHVRTGEANRKQRAALQKLLDKADKLAFQGDDKRAIKAYQECLFWLTRNEVPDKDILRTDVERKVAALAADLQA